MTNKILHLTKNDFEGTSSAILSKYIYNDNIDVKFFNYDTPSSCFESIIDDYEYVIAVGLKNTYKLKNKNIEIVECKNFQEMYIHYKNIFPEDFNTKAMEVFYDNIISYINWTWAEKQLYYGKNIDELCKYLGKIEVIENVAQRLANNEKIITETEKQMLIFIKKVMTNIIKNKKYYIHTKSNKKFAITYSDIYEIELANYILSQEKVDAVIIINMNTKIARIKTSKGINLESNILKAGGLINSNGGTIKFGDLFDEEIFTKLLERLD